jgi:N-acetylglutamate synthase-like GNAT family acetyltransferase
MNEDVTITCADCKAEFVWTIGEQEFYRNLGFTNAPKHCKACREKKRQRYGDVKKRTPAPSWDEQELVR